MPIYEYQCEACHHQFEAWQRMSDPAISECPNCQGHDVHKLISATSFHLKGTGWYATDYARKGSGPEPTSKKKDPGGGESGSSSSGTPSSGSSGSSGSDNKSSAGSNLAA